MTLINDQEVWKATEIAAMFGVTRQAIQQFLATQPQEFKPAYTIAEPRNVNRYYWDQKGLVKIMVAWDRR